jgi:RND family efflux transporter MFP subunit
MDEADYRARVAQAEGALLAARGQLDIAAKARENNRALLERGFISKNAYDTASSQYDIAQANVNAAQGGLDVSRKALGDTVIRAPIAGVVASRSVQPGEKVSADNKLLDVVDLGRMEMEVAVPTSDIIAIAPGQEVTVRVEGLPQPLPASVVRINPATQAGLLAISISFDSDHSGGTVMPFLMSAWRWPITWRSTVSTSALHLAAIARWINSLMKPRSFMT